jgi:hypothetical protein
MRKVLLAASILGVVAVMSATAAILDEEVRVAVDSGAELVTVADAVCQVPGLEPEPLFPSVLDGLRQGECSCRDLCRFDFQCGPGGACVPMGPCGCKECAYTS